MSRCSRRGGIPAGANRAGPGVLAGHAVVLTVSRQPAPLLTTAEAVDRMARWDRPFLFFLDADRGRGAVLYHRYDGHYGLITPAE